MANLLLEFCKNSNDCSGPSLCINYTCQTSPLIGGPTPLQQQYQHRNQGGLQSVDYADDYKEDTSRLATAIDLYDIGTSKDAG